MRSLYLNNFVKYFEILISFIYETQHGPQITNNCESRQFLSKQRSMHF